MKATEVAAVLAESNASLLPGLWRDSLHVTCGLTACTPGSAPGPTLGNEYGKTLPFTLARPVQSEGADKTSEDAGHSLASVYRNRNSGAIDRYLLLAGRTLAAAAGVLRSAGRDKRTDRQTDGHPTVRVNFVPHTTPAVPITDISFSASAES